MKAMWMASLVLVASGLFACNGDNSNVGDGGDASADVGIDAGPAKASIQDTSVDFGSADCGGAAAGPKTITIQNTGGAALTWSAKLDATDAFQLAGVSAGSIEGGASAQVTVNAKPIPSTSAAGQQFLTSLTITTSDPALASVSLPVSIKAQGATLQLLPTVADFGVYTVGKQAPDINLTLTNTGNKDATVAFLAPADPQFTIDWTGAPTGATVAAGGTTPMPALKAHFKPTSTAAANTSAPIQVTGAGVCGASATKIDLKGQGTNGALVYTPGTLDFGLTDCGTASPAQTFTLANTGNAPLSWTATPSSGAPYTLSGYGGVLVANSQQIVTVTPAAIPIPSDVTANLYGATFTITTDAAGDSPHTLTLKQTAHGAILTTNATTLDYGPNGKPGDTKTLNVSNTGNAKAGVYFYADMQNLTVTPTTNPTTIAGGANQNFIVTADPLALGPLSSTIKIDYDNTVGVICKPLPAATNVTGTVSATATQVVAHADDSCAITSGNRAYCWGGNNYFLGDAWHVVSTRTFGFGSVSAAAVESYSAFYPNLFGMCAADSSGAVSCRSNFQAQTALSNLTSGVTQVVTSLTISCALKADAVYCWKQGSNSASQVVASNAASITMGPAFSSPSLGVVKTDGTFWMGSPMGTLSQVSSLSNIAAASIGGQHACALDTSGAVWCFGSNYNGEVNGQPYNPGYIDPSTPFQAVDTDGVTALSGALGVASGGYHTCAIRSDNTVVCWGDNWDGELGTGSTGYGQGVHQTQSLTDAQSITAGDYHTCVFHTAGGISCWGANFYAQSLATGTSPYQVSSPNAIPYL